MNRDKTFAVVGGDLRQCCIANLLCEAGRPVSALCMGDCVELSNRVHGSNDLAGVLPGCDVVIFPLPLSGDHELLNAPFMAHPPTVSECLRYIAPGAAVFGGMVSDAVQHMAHQRGFEIEDYYKREELIVLNCIPTAEGALSIAMQETARTIFGSRCLITGFGRVSKAMARLLLACGAQVTVAARKQSDLAWIRLYGAQPLPIAALGEAAADADIIFNTVPVRLFDEAVLSSLPRDCLIIDLASKPGGVDFDVAKQLGIRVVWALSLPGKVAPITAAQIILDTVGNMLGEREPSTF